MQSGKIAPVFRQFFNVIGNAKSATDSDSTSQQKQQEQKDDREPTKEEAILALDVLSQQEEFQKSLLRAELRVEENRFIILVSSATGAALRSIRGPEVLRILEAGKGKQAVFRGRILDRRI
jgi:Sec-independent protein translocase protein TatA